MPDRTHEQIEVNIRWAIRTDLPEILNVEQTSFRSPWTEADFLWCMQRRAYICRVAEFVRRDISIDGEIEHVSFVAGFMLYALHQKRLHLLNFAVHPNFRRRGIGRQLIAKLVSKLSPARRSHVLCEIRETNLDAQLFFRSQGFRAISVMRDFYEDTEEDAYLMQFKCPVLEVVG